MTIVTKPITENKSDKPVEKPLVVSVSDGTGVECVEAGLNHFGVDGGPREAEEGEGKKKPLAGGRVCRMVVAPTKVFVFVGALCLLTCAIIYGIYVYRRYTHNQMSRLRVWCGVPLPLDSMPPKTAEQFRFEAHKRPASPKGIYKYTARKQILDGSPAESFSYLFDDLSMKDLEQDPSLPFNPDHPPNWNSPFPRLTDHPVFNEQFDLDLNTNSFQEIFVPDFGNMREGRFIHDLKLNLTAIVDVKGNRCFVFPMDYTQVATPRNLFQALKRMGREEFYDGNMIVIRETRSVIRPPVSDVSIFGPYIAQKCRNLQTFRLVKTTEIRHMRTARSADAGAEEEKEQKVGLVMPYQQTDDHFTVMEYAGKNIIQYTILDE